MKTNELQGAALDWAVAKCEGLDIYFDMDEKCAFDDEGYSFEPSCVWSQAGPIIERERICLIDQGGDYWQALWGWKEAFAPTPLVAAMRVYVASKLGDEVEVQDGLN